MSTLTDADRERIADYLRDRHIPTGIGTAESACSVAAINIALSGRLTDDIPGCMCPVIGRWMIVAQDAMPDDMRNSPEWRALIPLAAGTRNPGLEQRRAEIALDWLWSVVLPYHQRAADAGGYGDAWRRMCKERTEAAAAAAGEAAAVEAEAARAVEVEVEAEAARAAAMWAARAAREAEAEATAEAAVWAAKVATATAATAWTARAEAAAWAHFDLIALLRRMIEEDV